MRGIFKEILQVSMGMSIVIGILLMVLPRLRKQYNIRWYYFIWLLISVRLLIPISPEWSERLSLYPILKQIGRMSEIPVESTQTIEYSNEVWQEESNVSQPQEQKFIAGEMGQRGIGHIANEIIDKQNQTSKPQSGNKSLWKNIQVLLKEYLMKVMSIVWGIGILVFSLYYIVSYKVFKKICRRWSSEKFTEEEQALYLKLKVDLGVNKPIRLIKSKKVSTPLIIGYFKPIIILPDTTYSLDSLYFILKHELIHYQRKDLWYKLLLLIVRSVHWFNPLIHKMARQVDQDLEIGCDQYVIAQESHLRKKLYMQTILQIAEGRYGSYCSFTTSFKSNKEVLLHRFEAIVEMENKKKGIFTFILILIISIGCSGCFSIPTQSEEAQRNSDLSTTHLEVEDLASQETSLVMDAGIIASIEDYRVTLPEDWEIRDAMGKEGDYKKGKCLTFYKNGEKVGGITLQIIYASGLVLVGHEFTDDKDLKIEATNGSDEPKEFLYTKQGRLYYSEYVWTESNQETPHYHFKMYLNREQVSEQEALQIVDSFTRPIFVEDMPARFRNPLSLEEASQQATYIISYDTGIVLNYNQEHLERFKQNLEAHQKDSVELLAYMEENNGLEIRRWETLVSDGEKGYAYSYEKLEDGTFRVVGSPIIFDFIVKKEYGEIISYRLGYIGNTNTTRLFELTKEYIPGMSILNKDEEAVYTQLKKTKDVALLKDIETITIAKFYIQAELDSDFETQYALMVEYEPESKMIGWTEEEHIKISQEDTTEESKVTLLKRLGNIGNGHFIQQDENSGYIEFTTYNERKGHYQALGFQLEKNESGIWKVCFMPLQ